MLGFWEVLVCFFGRKISIGGMEIDGDGAGEGFWVRGFNGLHYEY